LFLFITVNSIFVKFLTLLGFSFGFFCVKKIQLWTRDFMCLGINAIHIKTLLFFSGFHIKHFFIFQFLFAFRVIWYFDLFWAIKWFLLSSYSFFIVTPFWDYFLRVFFLLSNFRNIGAQCFAKKNFIRSRWNFHSAFVGALIVVSQFAKVTICTKCTNYLWLKWQSKVWWNSASFFITKCRRLLVLRYQWRCL
jgi:hypothetical protein